MNKSIFVFAFLIVLFSCKHGENEYHGVTEKIKAEGENYQGISISSEKYLDEIQTIEITEGEHTFLIPERKGQIKSYACTECHDKPLDKMTSDAFQKAHWDIKLEHANKNTMDCKTCHNPNDINNLHSLTGKTIDFNTSYNLCSQCHSKQFNDWKGGAHGKRIGGWAPPRASMVCVNCHNPHNPKFESKWPARFNTETVKERE